MRESLGALLKSINESLGLYRDRLHPAGMPAGVDGWWQITDGVDALAAIADMLAQLCEHGWPKLTRLLDRQSLLDAIRAGDLGGQSGQRS